MNWCWVHSIIDVRDQTSDRLHNVIIVTEIELASEIFVIFPKNDILFRFQHSQLGCIYSNVDFIPDNIG